MNELKLNPKNSNPMLGKIWANPKCWVKNVISDVTKFVNI